MGFVVPFLSGGLGTLGSVAGIAATMGGIASGQAQSRQQAALLRYNAEQTRREAAQEAEKQKQRYAQLAESKKSGYAASGITLDSGSVLDNLAAIDAEGEVTAQKSVYGGFSQAMQMDNRARNTMSSSGISSLNAFAGLGTRMGSILGDLR